MNLMHYDAGSIKQREKGESNLAAGGNEIQKKRVASLTEKASVVSIISVLCSVSTYCTLWAPRRNLTCVYALLVKCRIVK